MKGIAFGLIEGAEEGDTVQNTLVELSLNVYACDALELP